MSRVAQVVSKRSVYILLTADRVKAFSSESTARRIYERAQRMGVKVEYLACFVKPGNLYKRAPLVTMEEALARVEGRCVVSSRPAVTEPEPGTLAFTARLLAQSGIMTGDEADAWKDQMKDESMNGEG